MTETSYRQVSTKWSEFLVSMKPLDGDIMESDVDRTDLLIQRGSASGRFRQCSIGWHDECSDRGMGECACPCHQYDKGDLIAAVIELEDTFAALRKIHQADYAGFCQCDGVSFWPCATAIALGVSDG
jgi:hypothetical protein